VDEKRGQHNRDKTHCKRGHEFTPENTITRGSAGQSRDCRACRKMRRRVGHEPYVEVAIVKPSELDLAWAAGFMDGEGCFTLSVNTGKQDWNRRPSMSASQVRILPIAKLQAMFGGKVRNAGAVHNGTSQNHFQWQLSTREMAVVIPWLMPYLTVKREEAEIVLAYAATVKRSRPGRKTLSPEEIEYRQVLVDRLREIRAQP
jgi:hypothetical protein